MSKPSFDSKTAQTFLRALSGEDPNTFQTFGDREKNPRLIRVLHGRFPDLVKELYELNNLGAGVYVTVCRTDLEGRSAENILEPRAVFLDFDGVEPPRGIGALPPSMEVQSRNGKHLYWKLRPGEDLELWKKVQSAMAARHGADPACKDPPRVMRLPGSLHNKAEPFEVKLLSCNPDRIYTLDAIVKTYDLDLSEAKPKAPAPRPAGSKTGPADDYNARGDWSMLERHGWTRIGDKGDETHWRRPGKDHGQLSATTDHQGRTGIFFNFSSSAAPFDASQGYTRFQVYSLLEHGGDYKAAAKALVALGFGDQNRDQWLKDRIREEESAIWESRFSEGPPPEVQKRQLEVVKPLEPPGGWGSAPEPPPLDDGDVPGEISSDPKGKKKGKGKSKGKGQKKSGGQPKLIIKDPEELCDFRVSKFVIVMSDPRIYYMEIEGAYEIEMGIAELNSPYLFRKRYQEICNRRPELPTDEPAWKALTDYWYSMREEIEQPEEASLSGWVRSELRDMIRRLRKGENRSDLHRGSAIPHPTKEGYWIMRRNSLTGMLHDKMHRQIHPNIVSAQLRWLNCAPVRIQVEGRQERVWEFRFELDDPDGWTDDGQGGAGGQGTLAVVN